jgi:hypothetical protein
MKAPICRKPAYILLLAVWIAGTCPLDALRAQVHAEPPARTQTIIVDTHAVSHPFPHFWERMFGSGRAILSLRDSYRRDLRTVKDATGFEYIRFHAIFLTSIKFMMACWKMASALLSN